MSARVAACAPPTKAGEVLTTAAPGAYTCTQGPTFENRATECADGFRAPTDTCGAPSSDGSPLSAPGHGHSEAGNDGRSIASLPAEQTTTQPSSLAFASSSYRVLLKSPSVGVSW